MADNRETNPVASEYADVRITRKLLLNSIKHPVTIMCIIILAALRLEDDMMQPVSDLYSVESEASVRLECRGIGNLLWSSSTGLQIPSDQSSNIYQAYDHHTRDTLTLVIQNFTSIAIATYTCMTNLTDARNSPITSSILISSCM